MILDKIKIGKILDYKIIDISDEEYFGSGYSDWVSNSKLSLINPDEEGSPEKFNAGLGGNKKYSDALVFGSAIHELTLQPQFFMLNETIDRPSGKPGFMFDYIINNGLVVDRESIIEAAGVMDYFKGNPKEEKIQELIDKHKDYYEYMYSEDRLYDNEAMTQIYLSSYDRMRAKACMDSINNNNSFRNLLHPEYAYIPPTIKNEATVLMTVEVIVPKGDSFEIIPIRLKGKLDNFTVDYEDEILKLNDLKTTGKDIPNFGESFEKYHYSRQMGLYLWMLKALYADEKHKNFNIGANMLVVQTKAPYTSKVFPVSLTTIQEGLKEAAQLIKRVAFHTLYGFDKNIEDYE